MLEVLKNGQATLDDRVAWNVVDAGIEANTAGVMLMARVV
jgi:hypothetical protein